MTMMLVAGFDNKSGNQVSVLRLREGQPMPRDHMQPGRVYGFYREEACLSPVDGSVLIPRGALMASGALSHSETGIDIPQQLEL